MGMQIGYCTNVHAGVGLDQTQANLREHAVEVKRRFSPDKPMGVGLWLSNATANELGEPRRLDAFRAWLAEEGLLPFTLNGFPYGDFHQPVVKHRVYEPTWCDAERREYTLRLVEILDQLLPPGTKGSISTLPIMWGTPYPNDQKLSLAAKHLRDVAGRLAQLEQESGRLITLCLEPEPGCVLQVSQDVVDYFERFLCASGQEAEIRRYLRVCHDVCHAAVMFESQSDVLERYRAAGIEIGKVQVSAAVRALMPSSASNERDATLEQLRSFAEDRYLHQTVVARRSSVGNFRKCDFFEDLPLALDAAGQSDGLGSEWRIHFHVPVYLERFGRLEATREQISECLTAVRKTSDVTHFEVETYAWGVLPEELRQPSLAAGIAEELTWFQSLAENN